MASLSYPLSAFSRDVGGMRWMSTSPALQSATWPPVRRKATGLQSSSVRAWILVVRPPRDLPIAWLSSPFFLPPHCGGLGRALRRPCSRRHGLRSGGRRQACNARRSGHGSWRCARRAIGRSPGWVPPFSSRRAAVGSDGRAIDEQLSRWSAGIGQGVEYGAPYPFGCPALEAVVECLPRTVDGRCVNPTPSALDDMDDAADHPPVIHARLATGVGGKVRSQLRELLVGQ